MNAWAIVLAAGHGTRLQNATNGTAKQFLLYDAIPLYWHSIRTLTRCSCIHGVVITFPEEYLEEQGALVASLSQADGDRLPIQCIAGGILRQDSVFIALQALPAPCDTVLVHDSSRPFFTPKLCHDLVHALEADAQLAGAIPYISLSDTIKEHDTKRVLATIPRERLARVQTPQIFRRDALEKAHAHVKEHHIEVSDDAAALELLNFPVGLVLGELANEKITHPHDLALLTKPITRLPCTGFGYDVHRFAKADNAEGQHDLASQKNSTSQKDSTSQKNSTSQKKPSLQAARPMRLGGVPLAGAPDIIAHSDGDIVFHALMDALLSLMCAGDLGTHFPDTDEAYNNISSAILLDTVMARLHKAHIALTHIDITIITQKPKIAPHRLAIQKSCANILQLPMHAVNVKATTEEHLGFTGEGKGIKVIAIASALKPDSMNLSTY